MGFTPILLLIDFLKKIKKKSCLKICIYQNYFVTLQYQNKTNKQIKIWMQEPS